MAKIKSFEDLFLHELQDTYDAEFQLTEALPKMAEAASSSELKAAFNNHLRQTKTHITRLEQVFKAVGEKPTRKTCEAMKGLIKEGQHILKEDMPDQIKDAALIASAQRVEHYEIAAYGTMRTFAYVLGNQEIAPILQQTLDEEEQTDKMLTQIANRINTEAAGESRQ
jgi:ferritin-like metal-binding protein YciE